MILSIVNEHEDWERELLEVDVVSLVFIIHMLPQTIMKITPLQVLMGLLIEERSFICLHPQQMLN
jgi:hypothetical protein